MLATLGGEGAVPAGDSRNLKAVSSSPASLPGTDHDLPASTLAYFIRADFRAAWDAVACLPAEIGARGNFIFARQAMSLIELAGRTCAADPSGQALTDLSRRLEAIDPRCFALLPGPCARPGRNRGQVEWTLPFNPAAQPYEAQLLWALFDLVRHGQAHQYQQIMVKLNDGTIWGVSLTGAAPGRTLSTVQGSRPADHLSQLPGDDGSLWLVIRPEVMFLDFEAATAQAGTFQQQLEPLPLGRRSAPGGKWDFSQHDLKSALRRAGLRDWVQPPPAQNASANPVTQAGWLSRVRRSLWGWIHDRASR